MKICRTAAQFEDSSIVLLARVNDTDNAPAVQADVSAILLSVYDKRDMKNKIAADVNLTPIASYVFDTLQAWDFDETGYNVRYVTDAAHLLQGDREYRFDMRFTHTNGAVSHAAWDVPTINLFRS